MNPDGVSEGVRMAEKAVCVAALNVSVEVVRSVGLEPWDFWLEDCGQIWAEALHGATPITLMATHSYLGLQYQKWWGSYMVFAHPAGLIAHAALVKRDSARRKALRGLAEQAKAVHAGTNWRDAYYRAE